MQFLHDIRLLPVDMGVCKDGSRVYGMQFGKHHDTVYLNQKDDNNHNDIAVLTAITELKSIPLRKYETIIGIRSDIRFGVRLVPRGYTYMKPPTPIMQGAPDALHMAWRHADTHHRDRVDTDGNTVVFIPRNLSERIPFVYEDTGELVLVR